MADFKAQWLNTGRLANLRLQQVLLCEEFGDGCNSVTKKSGRRYFGREWPPASPRQWPELGPPFAKTSGPSFQGAYRTGRQNVKSIVPDILKVSNFAQTPYSNLRKQNGSKHQSEAAKGFISN